MVILTLDLQQKQEIMAKQRKYKTKDEFKFDPEKHSEHDFGESLMIPGQAISPQELMRRHLTGQELYQGAGTEVYDNTLDFDHNNILYLDDLTDIDESRAKVTWLESQIAEAKEKIDSAESEIPPEPVPPVEEPPAEEPPAE